MCLSLHKSRSEILALSSEEIGWFVDCSSIVPLPDEQEDIRAARIPQATFAAVGVTSKIGDYIADWVDLAKRQYQEIEAMSEAELKANLDSWIRVIKQSKQSKGET